MPRDPSDIEATDRHRGRPVPRPREHDPRRTHGPGFILKDLPEHPEKNDELVDFEFHYVAASLRRRWSTSSLAHGERPGRGEEAVTVTGLHSKLKPTLIGPDRGVGGDADIRRRHPGPVALRHPPGSRARRRSSSSRSSPADLNTGRPDAPTSVGAAARSRPRRRFASGPPLGAPLLRCDVKA